MKPFCFDVMAGAAFSGSSKKPGLVIQSNVQQVLPRVELLMNMAIHTIPTNDFVVF
jgi:hypothetical protein